MGICAPTERKLFFNLKFPLKAYTFITTDMYVDRDLKNIDLKSEKTVYTRCACGE